MYQKELDQILIAAETFDDAVFSFADMIHWPDGALEHFIEQRILKSIKPALEAECDACEERCVEKVEFCDGKLPCNTRAYIVCKKRDDMGPVEVDMKKLKRWGVNKIRLKELGYYKEPEAVPESKVTDNYVFRPNGDFWQIVFQGKSLPPIKHNKRMFYLYELLKTPQKTISALELTRIVNKTTDKTNGNTDDITEDDDSSKPKNGMKRKESLGGIDKKALADYHRELSRLRAELAKAKANGDNATEDRMQGDIDFILQELRSNQGVQGKLRMFSDEGKRAADNISTAIRRVKKDIKAHSEDLYQHLENTIRPGNICSYRPDHAIDWQF